MLSDNQLEQVRKFAEEVAVREGCVLYDLEFHDGPARSLHGHVIGDLPDWRIAKASRA